MKIKKSKIAARVYVGRILEEFWERWARGEAGGFHAEVYMLILLRVKESLRLGGPASAVLTFCEISRQCKIDRRLVKADLEEMERQGLLSISRKGYRMEITLGGINASEVCRAVGGRKKVSKNAQTICTKNVQKNDANKEKQEKTKESAPAPPVKKDNKEIKERGCCAFSSATHTAGEGSKEKKQKAVAQGQQAARASMEERAKAFAETIRPYLGKYGKDMCNAFYAYWTEPNKSGTKMRWELERTWSIGGRLAKWQTYEPQFASKAQKAAAPVNTSAYVDNALQSMNERELERLRQDIDVVPRWAFNLLKKHGQMNENCTAAYALGFVRQLKVTGDLQAEEIELLTRWETKRQKAMEFVQKMYKNGENGEFEK